MNAKNWFFIFLIFILLAAGVFGLQYLRTQSQSQAANWITEPVIQGQLISSFEADGVVQSRQSAWLVWQTSGKVQDIHVQPGDQVGLGQDLGELDSSTLPQNLISANVDLVNAQQAYQDLYDSRSDLAIAQAQNHLAEIQKEVEDADYALRALKRPTAQADIDAAYATMIVAKNVWENTLSQVERLQRLIDKNPKYYGFFESRRLYENILKNVTLKEISDRRAYLAANQKYEDLQASTDPVKLAEAEARLALAQANLREAQKQLNDLLAGPSSDDLTAAEARIVAVKAYLDQAKITAPISGTVTQVENKPGDMVSQGTEAFRLDDLSHMYVSAQVSEIDINRLQAGQAVTMTFDAIPGQIFTGQITQVPPVGIPQEGITDFSVQIEVQHPTPEVRTGITTAAHIIVAQVENAIQVPNSAIRILKNDKVVYILDENGVPKPVVVKLGIASNAYSELTSGNLKPGDQVVINPPRATTQSP